MLISDFSLKRTKHRSLVTIKCNHVTHKQLPTIYYISIRVWSHKKIKVSKIISEDAFPLPCREGHLWPPFELLNHIDGTNANSLFRWNLFSHWILKVKSDIFKHFLKIFPSNFCPINSAWREWALELSPALPVSAIFNTNLFPHPYLDNSFLSIWKS